MHLDHCQRIIGPSKVVAAMGGKVVTPTSLMGVKLWFSHGYRIVLLAWMAGGFSHWWQVFCIYLLCTAGMGTGTAQFPFFSPGQTL